VPKKRKQEQQYQFLRGTDAERRYEVGDTSPLSNWEQETIDDLLRRGVIVKMEAQEEEPEEVRVPALTPEPEPESDPEPDGKEVNSEWVDHITEKTPSSTSMDTI